jgi:NADH:ubiquinone reductase (non-electrogenic)
MINNHKHFHSILKSQSRDTNQIVSAALNLILEKSLDTIEDSIIHLKRSLTSYDKLKNRKWNNVENIDDRPRLVVIGSGWSSHAFIKIIETDDYHVICVSPRPYFVFTPMLSSTAVGTVEYRSIIEPVRVSNPLVDYVEGEVTDIHPEQKVITIVSHLKRGDDINLVSNTNFSSTPFNLTYDYLVYAAGAQVADFGVPGVKKHCCFIKEIEDVRKLKNSILNIFEFASLPDTQESLLEDLLSFVVVGGGPTGVEFAGKYKQINLL